MPAVVQLLLARGRVVCLSGGFSSWGCNNHMDKDLEERLMRIAAFYSSLKVLLLLEFTASNAATLPFALELATRNPSHVMSLLSLPSFPATGIVWISHRLPRKRG